MGSLRRIDKRLLPHSLHARQNSGKSDAASELTDMLKSCTNAQEAILLRNELAEVHCCLLACRAAPFPPATWNDLLVPAHEEGCNTDISDCLSLHFRIKFALEEQCCQVYLLGLHAAEGWGREEAKAAAQEGQYCGCHMLQHFTAHAGWPGL